MHRGVAQLGSALRSGRRGRGFKSRHPDSKAAGQGLDPHEDQGPEPFPGPSWEPLGANPDIRLPGGSGPAGGTREAAPVTALRSPPRIAGWGKPRRAGQDRPGSPRRSTC
ncbi:Eukaryotic translation initiation factor 4B [Actinacidiphila cocklensis]|uniref:Eukaryotic translation initiation factor 4B n=1 Tax=Actinacidiphila cocklensis TaxID=887465 RepID=A0A9W4GRL4_9ACTN|nr:Eukaryotic translation initiation factor 4B [Actinacidiphila cocklensis]